MLGFDQEIEIGMDLSMSGDSLAMWVTARQFTIPGSLCPAGVPCHFGRVPGPARGREEEDCRQC